MKFCPNCGNELFGNPLYCPKCGFDLSRKEAQINVIPVTVEPDEPITKTKLRTLHHKRFTKKMTRYLLFSLVILLLLAGTAYLYVTHFTLMGSYEQQGAAILKTKRSEKKERASTSDLTFTLKNQFNTQIVHEAGYTVTITGSVKKHEDGWYYSDAKSRNYTVESENLKGLAQFFNPKIEPADISSVEDLQDAFHYYLTEHGLDAGKLKEDLKKNVTDTTKDKFWESLIGLKKKDGKYRYTLPLDKKTQSTMKFKKTKGVVTLVETDKKVHTTLTKTYK